MSALFRFWRLLSTCYSLHSGREATARFLHSIRWECSSEAAHEIDDGSGLKCQCSVVAQFDLEPLPSVRFT